MFGNPPETNSPAASIRDFSAQDWKIAAALALLALAVFLPTVRHGFITYDDGAYVFENPRIMGGLSADNILWALTAVQEQWWLPLLRLSFMTDVTLFGGYPWAFHLTNTLLHAANVVLLFLFLRKVTGARWPSAFVTALFAVHPMQVEAVAWVTARKDVLSGLFWMLGLLAYARYVEQPSPRQMALVATAMLLGLLSKSILMIFPLALLVLDFWPFQRVRGPESAKALVMEKAPLLALSVVFAGITLTTHTSARGGAGLPLFHRLALIFPNYLAYLGKLLWPATLSIFYPEHDVVTPVVGLASFAGLMLFTWGLWTVRHRWSFLAAGWFWFLVTLLPVIRGVRLGLVSMADRFTYIPGIGVFILIAWAAAEGVRSRPAWRIGLGAAAAVIVAACAVRAGAQVRVWGRPERLFEQALAQGEHFVTLGHLGKLREQAGRLDEALALAERALEIEPNEPSAHFNLARLLALQGQPQRAFDLLGRALELQPNFPQALNELGLLYQARGDLAAANECFQKAVQFNPGEFTYHNNLGVTYARLGRMEEAADCFARALKLAPHREDIQGNYERALREMK